MEDKTKGIRKGADLTWRLCCGACDSFFSPYEARFTSTVWPATKRTGDLQLDGGVSILVCSAVILFRGMLVSKDILGNLELLKKFLEMRDWLLEIMRIKVRPPFLIFTSNLIIYSLILISHKRRTVKLHATQYLCIYTFPYLLQLSKNIHSSTVTYMAP